MSVSLAKPIQHDSLAVRANTMSSVLLQMSDRIRLGDIAGARGLMAFIQSERVKLETDLDTALRQQLY